MLSTSSHYVHTSKFTRGEKCIFIHLIITFVSILALLIIYFIHLYFLEHTGNEIFDVTRKSQVNRINLGNTNEVDSHIYQLVGVLYLKIEPVKIVCNTLLLRANWSITPAHCATIRSDPDMSHYLPKWRLKYKMDESGGVETSVRRSLVHTYFNRDDCKNNIGLMEHSAPITTMDYLDINNKVLQNGIDKKKDVFLITWKTLLIKDQYFTKTILYVRLINADQCSSYLTPIIDQNIRPYEYCIRPMKQNNVFIYHGAILATSNTIVGFFSWSDRRATSAPLVILNIMAYKEWMEDKL